MAADLRAALVLTLEDKLSAGLNKITKLFDELSSLGKKLSLGKLENGSDGLRKTGMEAETLVGHLRGVSNAADRAWSALKRMGEAPVRKIGQALGAQGAIGALGAAAQGYSLYAPVQKYADFEMIARRTSITEGLSGAAANAETQRLMTMFRRDALASGQNSSNIGEAFKELLENGNTVAEAQGLLPVHSLAATAYGVDAKVLGPTVSALHRSFKISEDDIGGVLAGMAMASKQGRFKFEDFSRYMPGIGGLYDKAGMSGPGAANLAFASLETIMKYSPDAGTADASYRQFLTDIYAPHSARTFALHNRGMAEETRALLDQYHVTGINLPQTMRAAAKAGINPQDAVLNALEAKVKNLPVDVKAEVLGAFFGNQNSGMAAFALLNDRENTAAQIKRLSGADKALLYRDAATAMDGPEKKLEQVNEQFKQLEERAGRGFYPILVHLNEGLGYLGDGLSWLDQKAPGASDGILAVVGGVLAFGAVMGAIGFVTPSVTAGFNLLKAGFEFLLSPMQSVKWLLVDIALPLGLFVAALEGIKHLLPEGDKALEKAARPGGPLDGGPYGHTYDGYDVMGRPISSLPQLKSPGDSWSPGGDGGLEPRSAATPPVVTVMVGVDPDTGQLKINRAESNSRQVDIWSGYLNQGLAVGVP